MTVSKSISGDGGDQIKSGEASAMTADSDAFMPREYPSTISAWTAVIVLFLLYILSLADRYVIAMMVDPIKDGLGVSDFHISLLQGPVFAILYCLFAIPVGLALDRFSRRLVLFLCVIIWSLGATGCGLAGTFAMLAIARSLVGAGEAGFSTGAYSIIGDSFPPRKVSLAMSVFVMGGVMGAGIVFLLGGPLIDMILHGAVSDWPILSAFAPWQQAFIVTGLPGIAMAFLVFLFKDPPRSQKPKTENDGALGYGDALSFIKKHYQIYTAIFLGFGVVYTVTISLQLWLPSYLGRVHGWVPKDIGNYMGVAQILGALTLPLHGSIVGYIYRRGFKDAHLLWCILCILLAGPVIVAALMVPNPYIGVILFGFYMGFILSTASMGPASTQVVTPQHLRGRVSAIYVLTTGLIGMSVGPSIVGWITTNVFADEMRVGHSLIIVAIGGLALTVALFSWGRAQMRALMSEAEAVEAADAQ